MDKLVMRLSLIIPCFNEALNLPLLLKRCDAVTRATESEVVIVDNGSTDNTQEILSELLPCYPGCRSIRVGRNLGYGHGILAGLRDARGEIIGWTHADLQTDPMDVVNGIQLFQQYGDDIFVKGRRYGRPITDMVFTFGMSVFETLLLGKPMWDINAQPTLFHRSFFNTWKQPPDDFSLDLYVYFQAKQGDLQIKRFQVCFEARAHGVSSWNVNWSAKYKFIRRTVDYSLKLMKKHKS